MLLTRSGIVRDAISKGIFSGSWCKGANGGYFAVKPVQNKSEEQTGQVEVAHTNSIPETLITKEALSGLASVRNSPLSAIGLFVWRRIMGVWAAFRAAVRWS